MKIHASGAFIIFGLNKENFQSGLNERISFLVDNKIELSSCFPALCEAVSAVGTEDEAVFLRQLF